MRSSSTGSCSTTSTATTATRTGRLNPPFRPASLAHDLGSGYSSLRSASPEWGDLVPGDLDVHGRPDLDAALTWLDRPAILRTVRAHSDPYGAQFEKGDGDAVARRGRLDFEALWSRWTGGSRDGHASFYIHTGCEAISPPGWRDLPYSDPRYGLRSGGRSLLFFADGLALVGRAKVFYDSPRGFCDVLAEGGTFGDAWVRYFEVEAAAETPMEIGGDIGRKRAYFWSLLGDWTLRLRRPAG